MKKTDYEKMSDRILELAGGSENLKKISHCFTRLRLDVVELEKCDTEALKSVEGVKGCVVNNGQVQVIIGKEVEDLYDIFLKKAGRTSEQDISDNGNESLMNRFLNGLTGIFIPVFPALAAGGLLKGILLALNFGGVVDPTGGTYTMLMMFSDAVFYFLPIFLAYSSAGVFKCNRTVAVVLAGILLHPTYTGMTESGVLFGLSVPIVDYSSTVFPIIVGVLILSFVEKACKKVIPKSFSGLFTPLISVLVTAPIMLIVVGPAVNTLSDIVGNAVIGLYNVTGAFGGAVFGALYPFMVFTGLHHAVVPVELQSLAAYGYDPLLALCAAANAAVAGAALMVAIDSKNSDFKGLAFSSGITGLIGTTEPALYGVLAILKRPFIGAAIGGAAGSAFMSACHVYGSGLGPVPLAGAALFLGDKFVQYVIGIIISVAVAMIVTHIVGFEDVKLESQK
jgi:PTS system beta-glucosides-specific IIC component